MSSRFREGGEVLNLSDTPQIKLSFCIPTLNRAGFIGATLESIISQATEEIEIIVVDGGSTDNTPEVVARFRERFAFLQYIRKESSEGSSGPTIPSGKGFDRDCDRAVDLARGEYCWLFTDDDVLKPGAVRRVLDEVRNQYGMMIVNAEVRSGDLSCILETSRLPLIRDEIYTPDKWQTLFVNTATYLTFVGCVVIRRNLWKTRDRNSYLGTGFVHFGVVFQGPIPGSSLVIAEPLIMIRYGNALYARTPRYFEIWMFTWPNLIWSFQGISDSAKYEVCSREPWRRKRMLLLYRAKGAFTTREYTKWIRPRISSRWERLLIRAIACFPGHVANGLALLYYRLSSRWSRLYLVDLVKSPFYLGGVLKEACWFPGGNALRPPFTVPSPGESE